MPRMDEIVVLGVRVHAVDRRGLEAAIASPGRAGGPRMLAYVNVNAVNIAWSDSRFRTILNRAHLAYCDGEGIRVGARALGRRLPPRTVLTYWVWDICRLLEEQGGSVYFLGAREEVVEKAVAAVRARHPRLRIAGWHHGYFEKEGEESRRVVAGINAASPDVLFVGFGMPVQEYWISENLDALSAGVVLPSGSMIDYIAGEKKLTPPWMARYGCEWLYRLVREPRRLWRRYLIGNPLFLLRVIRHRILRGRA